MKTFGIILEIINTLAIVSGAIIAMVGVNAWKKQLKGSTEYELAKRYLRSVYKVRDAIKYVRNPFISIDEIIKSLKESGLDENEYSSNQKSNRAVYSLRWKKVQDAVTDLDVELLEAEVSWGKESVIVYQDLHEHIKKLYISLKMFLEERDIPPERDIIYDMGEEDKFALDIRISIEKIENFLKPHLK